MVKVSIIIPTNNRPDLLKRALASVINQSYQDWELFIINDSDTEVSINYSDSRIQIVKNNIIKLTIMKLITELISD